MKRALIVATFWLLSGLFVALHAQTGGQVVTGGPGASSGSGLPALCSGTPGNITCQSFTTSNANGGISGTEGTCAATGFTPTVGLDLQCPSNGTGAGALASHGWVCSVNGGAWSTCGASASGAVNIVQVSNGSGALQAGGATDNGSTFTILAGSSGTPSFAYGNGANPFKGYAPANFQWCMLAQGDVCDLFFNDTGQFVVTGTSSANCFGFSNSASDARTPDTCFRRVGSDVVALGTATASDESGLLRTGGACRITADVTLTVNVANSFCSWSFPILSKAWAWQCNLIWAITAGSGTNTFSLGVNASQTPASTTNAAAIIYTTQTGTQTQGVAALSASGAVNVLTSPTYTPVATLEQATASGTVVGNNGVSGTFAITATAAGTTATAAIKAGSVCVLH